MSIRDLTILGCSSQQSTRLRNHGAYLVRWNGEGLLFDPGEGTQRQFIFANIAPTCVTRIFVSHFHGDHCLGLGSMLVRLNLDKVRHPIHCYYPAAGKKYFDRLHHSTIYREQIQIIEHPVARPGLVDEDDHFRIEGYFLRHGVVNVGWRIQERPRRKFDRRRLQQYGISGPQVAQLLRDGQLIVAGRRVRLEQCSWLQQGDVIAVVIDTLPCPAALTCAKGAALLLCESTYLESHRHLAERYRHLTAKQAAQIACQSGASKLVLTHFSARYRDLHPFASEAREVFAATEVGDDLKVIPFPRQPRSQ